MYAVRFTQYEELSYHSLVYLLLKLLGFAIHAEPLTNLGRIDAALELSEAIYIIEKQYALPYRNAGKPILLLGIAFDPTNRNIADWQMEQVV